MHRGTGSASLRPGMGRENDMKMIASIGGILLLTWPTTDVMMVASSGHGWDLSHLLFPALLFAAGGGLILFGFGPVRR